MSDIVQRKYLKENAIVTNITESILNNLSYAISEVAKDIPTLDEDTQPKSRVKMAELNNLIGEVKQKILLIYGEYPNEEYALKCMEYLKMISVLSDRDLINLDMFINT